MCGGVGTLPIVLQPLTHILHQLQQVPLRAGQRNLVGEAAEEKQVLGESVTSFSLQMNIWANHYEIYLDENLKYPKPH